MWLLQTAMVTAHSGCDVGCFCIFNAQPLLAPCIKSASTATHSCCSVCDLCQPQQVRDTDLDTLEQLVTCVTWGDIEAEDTRHLSEGNFVKVFRLAQLLLEYLLYVQENLKYTNSVLDRSRWVVAKLGTPGRCLQYDSIWTALIRSTNTATQHLAYAGFVSRGRAHQG